MDPASQFLNLTRKIPISGLFSVTTDPNSICHTPNSFSTVNLCQQLPLLDPQYADFPGQNHQNFALYQSPQSPKTPNNSKTQAFAGPVSCNTTHTITSTFDNSNPVDVQWNCQNDLRESCSQIPRTLYLDSSAGITDIDLYEEFTRNENEGVVLDSNFPLYPSPLNLEMDELNVHMPFSSFPSTKSIPAMNLLQEFSESTPNSYICTNIKSSCMRNSSSDFNDLLDFAHLPQSNLDYPSIGDDWITLAASIHETTEAVSDANLSPSSLMAGLKVSHSPRSSPCHSGVKLSSTPIPRKRAKLHESISIEDPNDAVAIKRARNTLAARKSRQRKMQRLWELEEEICRLKSERDHWKEIALKRST